MNVPRAAVMPIILLLAAYGALTLARDVSAACWAHVDAGTQDAAGLACMTAIRIANP